MPMLLQHPHLFDYNAVFSSGLLIPIVRDENIHASITKLLFGSNRS
jgi:hypothetical protein